MSHTALITGASKRIGKALAEFLASKGWNIVIHFNSSESLAESLENSLRQKYPTQKFARLKADLGSEEETEKIIPLVQSQLGNLTLLINNASVFQPGFIVETGVSEFNNMLAVNLKTPFILMRDFAIHCKKGNIINFVDTRITLNKSDYAAYTLSKKGLWELTKMAALEFAPEIRVNAIAPGVTLPPEDKDEKYLWKLAKDIPMKKPGGIEPILKILDFILETNNLTGQLIFSDGGENLGKNL